MSIVETVGIYVPLPTGVVGEGKRQRSLHSYVCPFDVVCIEETASADGVPKAKVFLAKGGGHTGVHWVLVIGLTTEQIAERLNDCWSRHIAQQFLVENQIRGLDGVLKEVVRLGKAEILAEGRKLLTAELGPAVVSFLEKMEEGESPEPGKKRTK